MTAFLMPNYPIMRGSSCIDVDSRRKLVLHMDVNQTLIFADKVQNKLPIDVISHVLAKKTSSVWEEGKPFSSYHDYVFNEKIPGPRKDRALKKQRVALVKDFISFLETKDLSTAQKAKETLALTLEQIDKLPSYDSVVPSFYNLVSTLQEKGMDFSVIIRSFGLEVFLVADEISEKTGIKFRRGKFTRGEFFVLEGGEERQVDILLVNELFQNHCWAISGDWKHWNSNEEKPQFGKFFPFNAPGAHEMFFDDNIFTPPSKTNIVAPWNVTTQSFEVDKIKELIDKVQLIQADIIAAVLDPYYFTNLVLFSLKMAEGREGRGVC